MKDRVIVIIVSALILIVLVFFWPTLYRYDKLGEKLTRTNRITGETQEYLAYGTWSSNKPTSVKVTPQATIPAQEQAKITGKASISEYNNPGPFKAEIYNGSDYSIDRVMLEITIKEKDGSVRWTRKYEASVRSGEFASLWPAIRPMTSGTLSADIIDYKGSGSFEWTMLEIFGNKIK